MITCPQTTCAQFLPTTVDIMLVLYNHVIVDFPYIMPTRFKPLLQTVVLVGDSLRQITSFPCFQTD